MRHYDTRLHKTVKGAVKCLASYAPAGDLRFTRSRHRLEAHVARLDALHFALSDARFHRRTGSGRVRNIKNELREKYLIPIARRGKVLLAFAPGADPAFAVPHKRASADALLRSAARMLKLLKPRANARLFLDVGFSKGFVADLQLCVARLRSAAGVPAGAVRSRQTDAAAYAAELRAARMEMRVVEALVVARADTDERLLYMWRLLTRVGKRLGRPKKRRPGP